MRTTIELSDHVHRRLECLATGRRMRSFSPIVEDALIAYFESRTQGRVSGAILAAEGAWSEQDVAEWRHDCDQAWRLRSGVADP